MYLTSSSSKNLAFIVFVISLINLRGNRNHDARVTRNKVISEGF